MRILSYPYLQWRIRQLGTLVEELDPQNFHRLLRALDRLELLAEDLSEVLADSGNRETAAYEAAAVVEEKRFELRMLLEEPTVNDEGLEAGIAGLHRAMYKLARSLQATLSVSFPFSMN